MLDAGGDYLVIVKKNQRELYDAIGRLRSRCGERTGRPGGGAVTGIAGNCGLEALTWLHYVRDVTLGEDASSRTLRNR